MIGAADRGEYRQAAGAVAEAVIRSVELIVHDSCCRLTRIKTKKSNDPMRIRVPDVLKVLLDRRDRVHEHILTHKWSRPYTRDSLGHRIKDVLIANGDGQYTVHGLRKNAGIMLAENGATVPMIMAALGHKSPKLALYYTRLADQAKLV